MIVSPAAKVAEPQRAATARNAARSKCAKIGCSARTWAISSTGIAAVAALGCADCSASIAAIPLFALDSLNWFRFKRKASTDRSLQARVDRGADDRDTRRRAALRRERRSDREGENGGDRDRKICARRLDCRRRSAVAVSAWRRLRRAERRVSRPSGAALAGDRAAPSGFRPFRRGRTGAARSAISPISISTCSTGSATRGAWSSARRSAAGWRSKSACARSRRSAGWC